MPIKKDLVYDAEPKSVSEWQSLQEKALEEVNNNQTLGKIGTKSYNTRSPRFPVGYTSGKSEDLASSTD
ncbi:MAG: hypothetical protein HC847_10700 [Hydrococcus sp. RU_2_2]|nr:hypothetical protein [Hydrococcus sp. RU_2_2]NJP22548.1 hypothetical protein [Hydrococcus sp. CRU_1_1]